MIETNPEASARERVTDGASTADCLTGGGEMGAMWRGIDWSRTPVGPISGWSQPFRSMVGLVLRNRFSLCAARIVQRSVRVKTMQKRTFDTQAFLESAGIARTISQFRLGQVVFSQGDPCANVFYIQQGGVKLSVLSKMGRGAVVAMLGPGEFFGEGCLAGQPVRTGSATAVVDSTVLLVEKEAMVRLLHKQHALADRFIAHMLVRNIRIEQDLVDQLFNSSEKRLARTLLLLARYGKHDKPARAVPPISQSTMAEMVGTTRSRVNFFMKKFERLGFIDYKNGLKVNNSLLTVVLHD